VVTLFPELVEHALGFGVLGRQIERGVLTVETREPAGSSRRTCTGPWTTAPTAAGRDGAEGGAPALAMLEAARRVAVGAGIYLAADGAPVTQRKVAELSGVAEPGAGGRPLRRSGRAVRRRRNDESLVDWRRWC